MKRIIAALGVTFLVGGFAAAPVGATNGMDMIGYGARSIGMGGADVAVDGDASSVSGNPAVVSQAAPSSANIGATLLMPKLTYKDPYQKVEGEDQIFPMPSLGYVHALAGTPWSLGMGAYAQGGMGVDFKDVMTAAGTKDHLMSEVGYLRVNPLAAYKVSDDLSFGVSAMLGYTTMKFSMFPDTAGQNSGIKVEDLTSWGYAAKLGAQYKIGSQVRIGATYTSEAKIDMDGGTATVNFGPMGKVKYDAKMDDFTWPQEIEAGVAYLPIKGLTIAADVKWINWSATIDKPVLKLSNPNVAVPAGYETINNDFPMGWDDQIVYAIGAEYAISQTHTVRCGFNYANNPVPDDKLNPLFPAIPTTHATVGYGLNFGQWSVDLAFEHAFEKSQSNPDANGPDAGEPVMTIKHSQNTVSFGATYRY